MQQTTKDIFKRSTIRALWIVAIVFVVYLLQGCGNPRLAPVEERDANGKGAELHSFYPPSEVDNSQQFYFVQPADTLYSIAFRYGLDYKTLAESNNINASYTIYPGQKLNLEAARQAQAREPEVDTSTVARNSNSRPASPTSAGRTPVTEISRPKVQTIDRPVDENSTNAPTKASKKAEKKPTKKSPSTESKKTVQRKEQAKPVKTRPTTKKFSSQDIKYWMWPNMGAVIKRFSTSRNSRGIDIAANMGEPVRAAAPGLVVYAGGGLRGYGNLIIVKHNNEFISAYAHNKRLLVKENEIIKAGQKIAEIGSSDSDIPKLHFEIRFKGKPVDPLRYLPKR